MTLENIAHGLIADRLPQVLQSPLDTVVSPQKCKVISRNQRDHKVLGPYLLAERHFSPPGATTLVPSVGSAPLLLARAIAIR